jgi:hypothetical protein
MKPLDRCNNGACPKRGRVLVKIADEIMGLYCRQCAKSKRRRGDQNRGCYA